MTNIIEYGEMKEKCEEVMREFKYASLHNHTEYSNIRLLDSINKVKSMIDKALELNLKGLAITDHEVLSSHVQAIQYYQSLKEKGKVPEGFRLILGDEIYLVDNIPKIKADYEQKIKSDYYHFVLLAKNKKGYSQLKKISSKAWENSFRTGLAERVPIEKKQLTQIIGSEKGNLIGSTACLGGEFPKMVAQWQKSKLDEDKYPIHNFLMWGIDTFGKENFFIEVQPSEGKDQLDFNRVAAMLAQAYDIPMIATTDSHYLTKEDREIHKAYLNSKNGDREVDDFYSTTYMMDEDELRRYLAINLSEETIDQCIENTKKIVDMCEDYDLFHKQVVPEIDIHENLKRLDNFLRSNMPAVINLNKYEYIMNFMNSPYEQDRYFAALCFLGLINKGLDFDDVHLSRINTEFYEMWEISKTIEDRISKYYVTARKIIEIMWADDGGNSLVGPARGSVTGYFTAYLTDITQVNPITWNLPHWRHLSATRPELPDVDIDTEAAKRTAILHAMQRFFGMENVLNIATFGTEGSKSAVLTACRGLGVDVDTAQYIAGMIPVERGSNWSLHDCYYGNEDKGREPIRNFVNEVNCIERLKEVMLGIEGLINKRSIHASGVYIYNSHYTDFNAMMRAPNGQPTTQFNMNDSDYMGGLKFDFLTIQALDKIRVTMDIMCDDNVIEKQGSIKATYDKYFHPDVLDYKSKEMWNLMGLNSIVDLFQFDTQVGLGAAKKVAPHTLLEAANANSLMRLMAEHGKEQPIDKYVRFKADLSLWYDEMAGFGLKPHEVKVLEKHLKEIYGVADTQEVIMELVMDKNVANFSLKEANKLRKAIAKKKADVMAEVKQLFQKNGKAVGSSDNLLAYVWQNCIMPQAGYSFSKNHTVPYSIIALIELNLAYHYPKIYWNTACLTVNSGSLEVEDGKTKTTDYGKIAQAIGAMSSRGVKIGLPNINQAEFGFKADRDNERIIFGMKGINGIGDDLVHSIINNRPYVDIVDFLERVKINKSQMVSLIKAGAFDELEEDGRIAVMKKFIGMVADQKKRLTLQNFNGLINVGLVPEEYEFEVKVYHFNKYLKKFKFENYYLLDQIAEDFYRKNFDVDHMEMTDKGVVGVKQATWDRIYKAKMDVPRAWLKKTQEETLERYNRILFMQDWNKYCSGNLSAWEMESVCYYDHEHELAHVDMEKYGLTDFHDLPFNPVIERTFKWKGRDCPIYSLDRIVGTVLDKNKYRHTVTLLTTTGVVHVKLYGDMFANFDKQISQKQADGSKKVMEKSWFKRGNKLMITGFRREDQFVPKTYKNTEVHTIYKITDIHEDGSLDLTWQRWGQGAE